MSTQESLKHAFEAGVEDHNPDLYKPQGFAPSLESPAMLDDQQVELYHQQGYLSIANLLDGFKVQQAIAALNDLIQGHNSDFNGLLYEAAARNPTVMNDLSGRYDLIRKVFNFVQFDERLQALASDPTLLSLVSRLMHGRTPKLFQDMALLKPPHGGREKPWHQDHAYFNVDTQDRLVGVWIALDQADVDNGCMQVLHAGHLTGPMIHWKRRDWQICDTQMIGKASIACPLAPGGALFFDSLLPHGTPTNHSSKRRRALQFHYAPADAHLVPQETRLAVFGSEGKDVSC